MSGCRLFIVLALCLGAHHAQAAIAFVNAADGGNNGGTAATWTFSYTVTAGSDLLVIGFAGDNITGGNDDCSGGGNGVTYNGVSATFINKEGVVAGNRYLYLYFLLNPATGAAHNVVITCGSSHYILAGVTEYSGAATSGQPDNNNVGQESTGAAINTTITPVANNCWVMYLYELEDGATNDTFTNGVTRRTLDGAFFVWGLADSNAAVTGGSAFASTITRATFLNGMLYVNASFAPPAAAAATPMRTLMGVGQ